MGLTYAVSIGIGIQNFWTKLLETMFFASYY